MSKTFSNTRTKATWKPRVSSADLPFYECSTCHSMSLGLGGHDAAFLSDPGRNPVFNLPYGNAEGCEPTCCDHAMTRHDFFDINDLPVEIALDYRIIGGYNNNAVEFSWRIANDEFDLRWVALKTFTGMQLKYVTPKKRSPLIFALADEDAYVYCDESPCLECVFMCKRGFVLYAFVDGIGIARIPLERANAHWETKE